MPETTLEQKESQPHTNTPSLPKVATVLQKALVNDSPNVVINYWQANKMHILEEARQNAGVCYNLFLTAVATNYRFIVIAMWNVHSEILKESFLNKTQNNLAKLLYQIIKNFNSENPEEKTFILEFLSLFDMSTKEKVLALADAKQTTTDKLPALDSYGINLINFQEFFTNTLGDRTHERNKIKFIRACLLDDRLLNYMSGTGVQNDDKTKTYVTSQDQCVINFLVAARNQYASIYKKMRCFFPSIFSLINNLDSESRLQAWYDISLSLRNLHCDLFARCLESVEDQELLKTFIGRLSDPKFNLYQIPPITRDNIIKTVRDRLKELQQSSTEKLDTPGLNVLANFTSAATLFSAKNPANLTTPRRSERIEENNKRKREPSPARAR